MRLYFHMRQSAIISVQAGACWNQPQARGTGTQAGAAVPFFFFTHAGARPRIGLFGGSFNPPHEGHLHVSGQAAKRLGLDRVAWLVAPANPLKEEKPAAYEKRMEACRRITASQRVIVSDIERRQGFTRTIQTVSYLRKTRPGTRFVWIMGADSFLNLHKWEDWESIMRQIPVAVFARPGYRERARTCSAAGRFRKARVPEANSKALPLMKPPAWTLLNIPMKSVSSREMRESERGLDRA